MGARAGCAPIINPPLIAGMLRTFADPCTRISSQGKEDRLVVLLRITRKLMNTVCRLLKSCAAITGW